MASLPSSSSSSPPPNAKAQASPAFSRVVVKLKRAIEKHRKLQKAHPKRAVKMQELRSHLLAKDSNLLRIWRNAFDTNLHLKVSFRDFCKGSLKIEYRSDVVGLFVEGRALYEEDLKRYRAAVELERIEKLEERGLYGGHSSSSSKESVGMVIRKEGLHKLDSPDDKIRGRESLVSQISPDQQELSIVMEEPVDMMMAPSPGTLTASAQAKFMHPQLSLQEGMHRSSPGNYSPDFEDDQEDDFIEIPQRHTAQMDSPVLRTEQSISAGVFNDNAGFQKFMKAIANQDMKVIEEESRRMPVLRGFLPDNLKTELEERAELAERVGELRVGREEEMKRLRGESLHKTEGFHRNSVSSSEAEVLPTHILLEKKSTLKDGDNSMEADESVSMTVGNDEEDDDFAFANDYMKDTLKNGRSKAGMLSQLHADVPDEVVVPERPSAASQKISVVPPVEVVEQKGFPAVPIPTSQAIQMLTPRNPRLSAVVPTQGPPVSRNSSKQSQGSRRPPSRSKRTSVIALEETVEEEEDPDLDSDMFNSDAKGDNSTLYRERKKYYCHIKK